MLSVSVSISKCVKFGKEIQLLVSPKMANILYFLQGFNMTSFCTISNYVFSLGEQTLRKNTFFSTGELKSCVINSWLVFILFFLWVFIFLVFWFGGLVFWAFFFWCWCLLGSRKPPVFNQISLHVLRKIDISFRTQESKICSCQ